MQHPVCHSPTGQRGSVLIVTLMILVMLTILGIAAMATSTQEEKMAGGTMDQNIAFQAAESALRDAEQYIYSSVTSTSGFSAACTGGLCLPSITASNIWETVNWTGSTPISYGASTAALPVSGVLTQPKYIIELLPDLPAAPGNSLSSTLRSSSTGDGTAFRITAMGWGKQSGTQVMLQSIYVKQ
jgi:type IV pilus assembly protein PilX